MAVLQKLKEKGWYLTEEGLKKVSEDNNISDIQILLRKALDIDLRDISNGGLPLDFAKSSKFDVPTNGCIVQIQRIQNISAPKCNQESKVAPRMLLIELTDGSTLCSAIELEHLPALSINTPPGTKILLKGTIRISQGMLVLTPQAMKNCEGVVSAMVEKWENEKAMSKYVKGFKSTNNTSGSPPPWIPFGQKNQQTMLNDKSFKSLNVQKLNSETKEKDLEFIANRNEAIAEILKTKERKIFGGGNRQLLDHNVKKIMEKGYTEEQAKTSLKFARNNLEKAMGNLKRREERNSNDTSRTPYNETQKDYRHGRKGRVEESDVAKPPSNKVSLFDFLEDKIKIPKVVEIPTSSTAQKTSSNSTNSITSNDYTKKSYRSDEYQSSNRASTRNNSSNGMTTQSHPPVTDNRSKFENNISASFANRQKKDDDHHNNSKSYNDSRGKWNGKSSVSTQRQNSQDANNGSNAKQLNSKTQPPHYSQSSYQNSNSAPNSSRGQKFSKIFNETGKLSRFDEKPSRNDQNDRRNNTPYNVCQLSDATASMSLSNNKRTSYNQSHQSTKQQPTQPSNRSQSQGHGNKMAPLPNGFEYTPYKIMGFQNKETNEFAMNVLKNQNFDGVPPNVLRKAAQPVPSEGFVSMPSN